jgi:glucokinase
MNPILVADIGGTHFSAGLLLPNESCVSHTRRFKAADFAGPEGAVNAYLESVSAELGGRGEAPRLAAFAVATPISGDHIQFTNSAWSFSVQDLQRRLGLSRLRVVNDFEALALSLPHLSATQMRCEAGVPDPLQVMAVLGPGTGLGVAGVCPISPGIWRPLPTEGGHSTLAAGDDFEANVLQWARREHSHVSAERLLSGMGLPLLHSAVSAVMGKPSQLLTAPEIIQLGVLKSDESALQTINTFCAMLGSFAGNVALTLGARGGVFIGGGIVPRLGELFFQSPFRQRFESKGRFTDYLKAIPTALIVDQHAALQGAARSLVE